MNISGLNDWATSLWGPGMLRACGQGALAVAVVWGICRLFPRLPSALRTTLWWLACVKTLISISVVGPVAVAVLPADPPSVSATAHSAATESTFQSTSSSTDVMVSGPREISEPSSGIDKVSNPIATPISPVSVVFCFWLAGVGVLLVTTGRGLLSIRKLVKQARPVCELTVVREVSEALGLRRVPTVLISDHADCSLVIGPWRPVVVLCRADLDHLSEEEIRALLAHEFAHIRRRDLWAGLLPNLARLVFFFNPLVWLACREYDMAREAACDAEALQVSGMPPAAYGRLLLKLGIGPVFASPRLASVAALGAASPYSVHLKQRVQGLRWYRCSMPRWVNPVLLVIAVGIFCLHPVRVVAKSALTVPPAMMPVNTPNHPNANRSVLAKPPVPVRQVTHALASRKDVSVMESALAQSAPPAQSQNIVMPKKEDAPMLNLSKIRKPNLSVAATAAALTATGTHVLVPTATAQDVPSVPVAPVAPLAQGVPPVPPLAPIAHEMPPVPPLAPLAPLSPIAMEAQDNAQKPRYQYTLKRGTSYTNHTWDKAVSDGQRALAKAQAGDALVVDHDGKRYLITDAATINQIKESYAPVEAIARQMEATGKQLKEELAKPMEELRKHMEELGQQMRLLGGQMSEQGVLLEAAHKDNKPEADRKAIQGKMEAIQEKMKAQKMEMKSWSDKMHDQSAKMRPHNDQMQAHGNRIRLAVKEAEAKVFSIIDTAFQNNLAVEQKG
jgi:beta-lactamase regulating signal transducer with metallopeptidase domain